MSIQSYSTSKVNVLKAKQNEDEWAKIMKADSDKNTQLENQRKTSEQNQKKHLQDFLRL